MDKKFILDNVTYHRIGENNLFIIPSLPSWFVLSDEESIAFRIFLRFDKEKDIINYISKQLKISNINAKKTYKRLLKILKKRKVYASNEKPVLAPDSNEYPTNIHLALTHKCNLRCKHCYIDAGNSTNDELKLYEWIKGFNNLLNIIPKPDITISGGEPTCIEFLPDLLKFLEKRANNIVFYTNGLKDTSSILPFLDEVQVSIEGLSNQTHDYIRGKGVYRNISKFIYNFPEKSKLKIAFTIMSHNFEELKEELDNWLSFFDLKISNMRFNAELENYGRGRDLPKEFHSFLYKNAIEVFKFISEMEETKDEPAYLLKNMRNCGIGISIGIDSNGDIYPCDMFVNKQGNILDNNLEDIIKKSLSINEKTEISKIYQCSECDLKYICLGGCKAKNYEKNNSYLKPTCNEKTKYIKYAQMIYDVGL